MKFLKMEGAGNDFVLVDGRDGQEANWPELARRMSDRHFGVGADGLLLVQPSDKADVRMLMWNPDGSESEMCGNGIRCFAKYVFDAGLPGSGALTVETGAGVLAVTTRGSNDWLQVSMGRPVLNGRHIPIAVDADPAMDLDLPGLNVRVTCVGMGNPHAVRFVEDVWAIDLKRIGPAVEHHPLFPNRVNFHICQVISRTEVAMRSWERGVGLTLACGTGACAAAVACRLHGLTAEVIRMRVPGGELELAWDGQAGEVMMTGPARLVFEGDYPGND